MKNPKVLHALNHFGPHKKLHGRIQLSVFHGSLAYLGDKLGRIQKIKVQKSVKRFDPLLRSRAKNGVGVILTHVLGGSALALEKLGI